MTEPEVAPEFDRTASAGYVHFLEAIVAAVAIKAGLNPNTMMRSALQEIAASGGMSSEATQRIIEQRWTTRDLSAATVASRLVEIPTTSDQVNGPLVAPQTAEPVDARSRFQAYKERKSEAKSDSAPPTT